MIRLLCFFVVLVFLGAGHGNAAAIAMKPKTPQEKITIAKDQKTDLEGADYAPDEEYAEEVLRSALFDAADGDEAIIQELEADFGPEGLSGDGEFYEEEDGAAAVVPEEGEEVTIRKDIGIKKTIFIPKLNKTIVIDSGALSIPGFGRLIFESVLDKATGKTLLRGRPEKATVEWGPVTIKKTEFTLDEITKDFSFKASIYFLNREILQPTVESFSEDGLLRIKCVLPNPIWIPISPWATFVIDALYLEKDKQSETLTVNAQAVLKEHPEIKIDFIFLKDPEVGTVAEASLERLPLSYVIAPLAATPFSKITLNQVRLRKEGVGQQAADRVTQGGVSMEGMVNFGGLLSSLPVKVDNVAFSLIAGVAKAPITLKAKIPQDLAIIPSLLSVKDPTIVLQYAEQPPAEKLYKPTLAKKKEEVETIDDIGKKVSMQLLGAVRLSLPVVGEIATTLTSQFKITGKEKGFSSFTGRLDKPLGYGDKVSVENCTLVLTRRVVAVEEEAQKEAAQEEEKEKTKSAYKLSIKGDGIINAEDVARFLPALPGLDVKPLLRQKLLVTLDVVKTPKGLGFVFEGLLAMPKPLKPFEQFPGLEKIKEVRDIEIKRLGLGFDSAMNMYLTGDTKILGLEARAKMLKTIKGFSLIVKPVKEPQITDVVPAAQGTPIQSILLTDLSLVISSAPYQDETTGQMMPKGLAMTASVALSGDLFANVRVLTKGLPAPKLTLIGMIGASLNDLLLKILVPMDIEMGPQITCKNVAIELAGAGPSISMLASIAVKPTPQDKPLLFTGRIKVDPDKASGAGTMQGEWKDPLGVKGLAISDCAFEMGIDYSIFSNTGVPTVYGITGGLQLGTVKAMMATKIVGGAGAADSILAGRVNKLDLHDLVSLVNAANIISIPIEQVPQLKIEDVDITIAPKGGKIGEIRFEQGVTVKGKLSVLDKFAMVNINVDPSVGIIGQGSMSQFTLGPLNVTGAGFDQKEGTADDGPTIDIQLTPEKQLILVSGLATFNDSKAIVDILFNPQGGAFTIQTKLAKTFNVKLEGSTATMQTTGYLESDFKNFIKEQIIKRLDVSAMAADAVKLKEIEQKLADIDRRIADKNREIEAAKGKFTEKVRMENFTRWKEKTVCVGVGRWKKCHTERIPVPDVRRIVDRIPFDIGPLVAQRAGLEAERAALVATKQSLQTAVQALGANKQLLENIATSFEVKQALVKGNLADMSRGTGAMILKINALGQDFDVNVTMDSRDMGPLVDNVVDAVKKKLVK